jgi:predicted transglutaminase-like cysteine proteinase
MSSRTLGIVIAALLCLGQTAHAKESGDRSVRGMSDDIFAPVYGQTLPPIGFVDFCAQNRKECRADDNRAVPRVALSGERWKNLNRINSYVNGTVRPVSDAELYKVPERWTYPVDAGDCEDYVLLKKRFLETLGFPAASLLITVVLDERGEGHAVLTAVTDKGDFILDNRRDQILRWSQTDYRFLKRQSAQDPKLWVALAKEAKPSTVSLIKSADGNE